MSKDEMQYKGYYYTISYEPEDDCLTAEVLGLKDSISAQGKTPEEVRQHIRDNIDFYLELCEKYGETPDRAYSGQFNVRVTPAVHRKIAIAAEQEGISLNQYVGRLLSQA